MNAKEALDLLEPIPSKNFITSVFGNGDDKCCAVGHLVRLTSETPNDYSLSNCGDFNGYRNGDKPNGIEVHKFRELTRKFITEKYNLFDDISGVNNEDYVNGYTQKKPKTRVINLLKDMVNAGY